VIQTHSQAGRDLTPQPSKFELNVRRQPDALVIAIRGELTDPDADRLNDKLRILSAWRRDRTVLDLDGLVFMSCRSMCAIIDYWREVKRHGGAIVLKNPRPEIRDAFLLVGVHGQLPLVPDLASQE
jgi:anti-anti-sigma factor